MLWAAGLLAGAQFAKASVLLPEIRELYPEQSTHVAWLLTLVSIVGAVFGGIAGTFANRVGPKRFLVASLFAAGGLSLWQSTYPVFAFMAASRVLEGVAHLGIVVTAPALMAQISSDRWRGATMSLWSTFFAVSFALFAWFGIPQVDDLQVSGLFQLHGACLILVGGLVWSLLPTPREDAANSDTGSVPKTTFATVYTDVKVIWPGVGWLFYTLTFLALLTILPAQMADDLRPQMTTAMSLVGIAISLLVVPLLLTRLRATTIVQAGFALALAATLLGTGMNVLVLAILLFSILGMVQGGTFAAVAELNQSTAKRTIGYGFMAQTGNLGNLIGTPILLFVLDSAGQTSLLIAVSAIYGVGVLGLLTLARRLRALEDEL